ncbi:MAG: hypothetical protein KDC80_13645 [Saprospiraceae bacterium]|nr:hypothetical protein [Saprospiraceae bacterium]
MIVTRKDIVTTVAFLLFLTGFTSLTLSLVGIRWSFLAWIDDISTLLGFLVKIGMILLSIILLVVINSANSDEEE